MRSRIGLNSAVAFALLLALTAAGCNPFRRTKAPPPAPPAPAVQKPATAPVAQTPAPEPARHPPVHTPEPEPPPDTRTVRLPEPTPPPARLPKTQTQPAPAPAEPAPPAPAPPPPELGQILTPQERQHYTRLTDEALARARGLMRKLDPRRFTPDQRAAYDRILTFIRQAEQLRPRDLVQAAGLAERAAVLAADLAASMP